MPFSMLSLFDFSNFVFLLAAIYGWNEFLVLKFAISLRSIIVISGRQSTAYMSMAQCSFFSCMLYGVEIFIYLNHNVCTLLCCVRAFQSALSGNRHTE